MAKRKVVVEDEDGDAVKTPSDAYVGLLGICLVALLVAAVLLYLDADELAAGQPQPTNPPVKLTDTGLNKPGAPVAP